MLLDSNRPAAKCLSRGWQIAFVLFAAALVCGLSLVTLRSLVADEEPLKTIWLVTEPATDQPAAKDLAPPGPEAKVGILLQTVVFEADAGESQLLFGVGEEAQAIFSHPDPRIEVKLRDAHAIRALLDKNPALHILSRPQILTLDGTAAHVQVSAQPFPVELEGRLKRDELGLNIEITPRLKFRSEGPKVQLTINLRHKELEEPVVGDQPVFKMRAMSLSVEIPLGKTVVIAQQPAATDPTQQPSAEKSLVLTIEPQIITVPGEDAAQAANAGGQSPATREIQQRLTELRGQIDRLAAAPTDKEAAGVRHAMLRLERDLDRLLGPGEPKSQKRVYPVDGPVAAVARQINEQLKERKIEGVKVQADTRSNSLIVVAATDTPYEIIHELVVALAQVPAGVSIKATDQPKPAADIDSRPPANYHPITGEYPVTGDATKLAKQVEERFKAERIVGSVAPDAKSRLIVSAPGYDDARIRKIIKAVEAEQALHAAANEPAAKGAEWKDWIPKGKPEAGEASANDLARQAERETQLKLMKLDMEDAVLARDAAKADLEREMEVEKSNPGVVSRAELRKHKFQVDRAEIQIRRLQIMLEGLEKPVRQPGPISR